MEEKYKMEVSKMPKNLPKGSIMLNNDRENKIPDLIKLTGQIIEFIEYIETPEAKNMAKENKMLYKHHLENKFEEFTLEYYSIYKMLVENENERAENIERLFKMIDRLKDVESGKSNVDREFIKIREELAQDYLYPQFGGREAFQKALSKDLKNKKK
jgi:hypothetical protein